MLFLVFVLLVVEGCVGKGCIGYFDWYCMFLCLCFLCCLVVLVLIGVFVSVMGLR